MLRLAQENKFGFTAFDYNRNVKKIWKIFDKLFKENVRLNKPLKDCFPEFAYQSKKREAVKFACKPDPLTAVGNSGKLRLFKHPYIQAYVDTCWKLPCVRVPFYFYVLAYILFFASLCSYVSLHHFTQEYIYPKNNPDNTNKSTVGQQAVVKYTFYSLHPVLTLITSVATMQLAISGMFYKFTKICCMGQNYFKNLPKHARKLFQQNYFKNHATKMFRQNCFNCFIDHMKSFCKFIHDHAVSIADMIIYPGAFIITVVPYIAEYNAWIHILGCILILMAVYRATVMLTHMPFVFGTKCLMLLVGVKNVAMFCPIFLVFAFAFGIVFHDLLLIFPSRVCHYESHDHEHR